MSNNRRFALDEKRHVIDAVNPANSGKGYCHEGDPEDDRHLRDRILIVRLGEMLDKLLWPHPSAESHSIFLVIYFAIDASHLNSFDPVMSIQHTFGGTLKRNMEGGQHFTSLSLFRHDVERLLRDLYGDIESEALDRVLRAVFRIVQELTENVRPDLWKEHSDAVDLDYILGIGVSEESSISGWQWRCGMRAKVNLFRRVREVNANPYTFSEYTREFAKLFAERWDCTDEGEWEAEWMPC